jgi:hypothetical protein
VRPSLGLPNGRFRREVSRVEAAFGLSEGFGKPLLLEDRHCRWPWFSSVLSFVSPAPAEISEAKILIAPIAEHDAAYWNERNSQDTIYLGGGRLSYITLALVVPK